LFDGSKQPPDDAPLRRAATIVQLEAKILLATGKPRAEAIAELDAIADRGGDQRARYALGAAYQALGDLAAAKRELRRVVEETSADRPDPFGYRTHQRLAEIALATNDLATAGAEIERAIAIHPGNGQSYAIQGAILVRRGEPERALEKLAQVRKLGELVPAAKLVVAEALVTVKNATTEQRAQAKQLLVELKGALPPAEVGRVAALVDPKLPAELGVPVGKLPKQGT
jgi:Tfp pilus assembly protein PilF